MKKRKEKRKISVLAIGYCAAILSAGVLTACSGARKDTSYSEDNSIKSGVYGEAEAERSDEAAFAGAQVAKSNARKDSIVTKENEVPGASQGEAAEETVPEVAILIPIRLIPILPMLGRTPMFRFRKKRFVP